MSAPKPKQDPKPLAFKFRIKDASYHYGPDPSGLIKRVPELDVRRAVHVKLLPDTHASLRLLCVRRGLSIQELLEEVAQRAIISDPAVTRVIEDLVKAKKERYFRQLSSTDAEALFDVIESESPLE